MKKHVLVSLSLSIACLHLGGCIAAVIASAAYASSISDDDRKAFHANNIEREKAGLKPLTLEEWEAERKPAKAAEPPQPSSDG